MLRMSHPRRYLNAKTLALTSCSATLLAFPGCGLSPAHWIVDFWYGLAISSLLQGL